MAKYSTGGGGDSAGESCELCGADGVSLTLANVAGAELMVCSDCAQHGDGGSDTDPEDERRERDRKQRAARNTARMHDASRADSSHWEDGADYDDDQLPYLVDGYGDRLREARRDAGLQPAELAEELGADENDILAVEQGRATQANVGGSLVAALEDRLDVTLSEG